VTGFFSFYRPLRTPPEDKQNESYGGRENDETDPARPPTKNRDNQVSDYGQKDGDTYNHPVDQPVYPFNQPVHVFAHFCLQRTRLIKDTTNLGFIH
jgi:hypothetical protein